MRPFSTSSNFTDNVPAFSKTEGQVKAQPAEDDSDLTYSKEYYLLHREDILQRRKEKEMEAKFGDFSARLVKRPKKNFMWGFGTQQHDEHHQD